MTILEEALSKGMKGAHKSYCRMSDGYWLDHAPEHFIQVLVALEIAKHGYAVFPDVSYKRTQEEFEVLEQKTGKGKARAYFNLGQRPDLLIWRKTTGAIYGVVEIKRAWSLPPISRDAIKIENAMRSELRPENGYVLVYSTSYPNRKEKNPTQLLEDRFDCWSVRLKWKLLECYVTKPEDGETWGFCLLKWQDKI